MANLHWIAGSGGVSRCQTRCDGIQTTKGLAWLIYMASFDGSPFILIKWYYPFVLLVRLTSVICSPKSTCITPLPAAFVV